MKKFTEQFLEKLKAEYPLPKQVKLTLKCYAKEDLPADTPTKRAWGQLVRTGNSATIKMAVKRPSYAIIQTLAHEYYHCVQHFIYSMPYDHPLLEEQADAFANKYLTEFFAAATRRVQ